MPIQLRVVAVSLLLAGAGTGLAAGAAPPDSWMARLAELGRQIVRQSGGSAQTAPAAPSDIEREVDRLSGEQRGTIRKAIDQAFRSGSKEERLGALALYDRLVSAPEKAREPLNGAYPPLFYRLIQEDDRALPAYTEALAGAFAYYPRSRLTVLAYMDIARRATDAPTRERYVTLSADSLSIPLPIAEDMPVLQRERILCSFEAWFEKNSRYIKFDTDGRSVLAGSRVPTQQRRLSEAERARIRENPSCVLDLIRSAAGAAAFERAAFLELLRHCGEAAFGAEAAAGLSRQAAAAGDPPSPSFDQTIRLTASHSGYPWLDTGLLAVAYVAADDSDPTHLDLARKTLPLLGPPDDLMRIVEREAAGVQEKARQLIEGMH
jgi:hypothetical protein